MCSYKKLLSQNHFIDETDTIWNSDATELWLESKDDI